MCGALKESAAAELEYTPEESLHRLAEIYNDDPLAVHIMLKRLIYPHSSHRQLAEDTQYSREAITKKIHQLAAKYPGLARLLGQKSPRSQAQRERWMH